MAVVFGLAGLVVLVGLFFVVEFVGVGVFLPLSGVGHFGTSWPTALHPGVRVPSRGQSLVFSEFPGLSRVCHEASLK